LPGLRGWTISASKKILQLRDAPSSTSWFHGERRNVRHKVEAKSPP
jgi:hypothetical protein